MRNMIYWLSYISYIFSYILYKRMVHFSKSSKDTDHSVTRGRKARAPTSSGHMSLIGPFTRKVLLGWEMGNKAYWFSLVINGQKIRNRYIRHYQNRGGKKTIFVLIYTLFKNPEGTCVALSLNSPSWRDGYKISLPWLYLPYFMLPQRGLRADKIYFQRAH